HSTSLPPQAHAAAELTWAELAPKMREAVKDKRYLLWPLGEEVADYLRHKRKRLTEASYRDYEGGLSEFVLFFADLRLADFEPPVGTRRLEEFLDHRYGHLAPRTYNKNLSILGDFFEWHVLRENLHGDPTTAIERARKRDVYRTTFTKHKRRAILAENPDLRD